MIQLKMRKVGPGLYCDNTAGLEVQRVAGKYKGHTMWVTRVRILGVWVSVLNPEGEPRTSPTRRDAEMWGLGVLNTL